MPETQPAATEPPTPDYDHWTLEQIAEWAASAPDDLRTAAITYETANQNRAEVLEALGATGATSGAEE